MTWTIVYITIVGLLIVAAFLWLAASGQTGDDQIVGPAARPDPTLPPRHPQPTQTQTSRLEAELRSLGVNVERRRSPLPFWLRHLRR